MKKILSFLLALMLLFPAGVFASTSVQLLEDSSGTDISSYALTSGSAVQSKRVRTVDNAGFMVLLVTEAISGGTGDVDIYMEYSIDGTNWYRPYVSDMAGTISVEGNVVTALQNVTRYIVLTPRLAPYARVVFDPDANSEITAYMIYQRD